MGTWKGGGNTSVRSTGRKSISSYNNGKKLPKAKRFEAVQRANKLALEEAKSLSEPVLGTEDTAY